MTSFDVLRRMRILLRYIHANIFRICYPSFVWFFERESVFFFSSWWNVYTEREREREYIIVNKKKHIVHTSKSIFFFLSSDERWRSIIPLASIDISIFISEDCDEKKKRMSFASHIWERKKKNIPLPMVFSWTLWAHHSLLQKSTSLTPSLPVFFCFERNGFSFRFEIDDRILSTVEYPSFSVSHILYFYIWRIWNSQKSGVKIDFPRLVRRSQPNET